MNYSLFPPILHVEPIERDTLNRCLVDWQHKMGAWTRPKFKEWLTALFHNGRPVAVMVATTLIRKRCAGLSREDAIELGRVCAVRPHINRAALRLWREFIFPDICASYGCKAVISYQDAVLHSGDLYRFDGWTRIDTSRSGTDQRTGAKGRSKVIWAYGDLSSLENKKKKKKG
ncbi:hypothetical protein [Mesorhizobium sp.]|uniref:hypothetical protein n=1 Tax=Mesorhizobium sp. TaxID=1871066 RepID=UPI00120385E8|nr:hypothetical protein [Mesorhizobium sp.]TIN84339.1 MAG: hypothetical protein E5X97_22475 [Mesorhizobium sp.]